MCYDFNNAIIKLIKNLISITIVDSSNWLEFFMKIFEKEYFGCLIRCAPLTEG